MIENVVENWLTKSSERSYQAPFCFLLQQEGMKVVHMTRHCAMEFGKDVIAVDEKGQVHAYQLKGVGGKHFTLSDWQAIQGQVLTLVTHAVSHPSISSRKHHKSYLVINGYLNEEASYAIRDWNSAQEKTNKLYRLEVIGKAEIMHMALRHKEQLMPSELVDIKSLLELYLRDGKEFLDKENFSLLLNNVLNGRKPKSKDESLRMVSSAAVVASLAVSSCKDAQNHLAVVEAWSIYIFTVLGHCERFNRKVKDCKNEIALAKQIIKEELLDLLADCGSKPEMFQGNPMEDAFVLKPRKTMLLGMLAFLATRVKEAEVVEIKKVISDNFESLHMWGESALPFFLSLYFMYSSQGDKVAADELLIKTFACAMNGITKHEISFTDIYTSAEDAVIEYFSKKEPKEKFNPRISRIIEPLLAFVSTDEWRPLVERYWPEISRCVFTELKILYPFDFYLWRADDAESINKNPNRTQSWTSLCEAANSYDITKIPQTLNELKDHLPLFLMVYPHRVDADLLKWFLRS